MVKIENLWAMYMLTHRTTCGLHAAFLTSGIFSVFFFFFFFFVRCGGLKKFLGGTCIFGCRVAVVLCIVRLSGD
jgi:hypothetical protein